MHYHVETNAPILPYKRIWHDSVRGIQAISFATRNSASLLLDNNISHNKVVLQLLLCTDCNIIFSWINQKYLHLNVCCWELEFKFLRVPTHSRLPSQPTLPLSTFPTHHRLWDTTVGVTEEVWLELCSPLLLVIQGGSYMTGTDLYVNKPHCAAAVRPWESEATNSTLPPARVRTCSVLSGSC